jgi:hypothetical protein
MIMAAPPPPPTIVAAVKAVYPHSPIRIARICRVDSLALVRLGVRAHESFVALGRERRGWRVLWVDGKLVKSVPAARRPAAAAAVSRLRTRCLAP